MNARKRIVTLITARGPAAIIKGRMIMFMIGESLVRAKSRWVTQRGSPSIGLIPVPPPAASARTFWIMKSRRVSDEAAMELLAGRESSNRVGTCNLGCWDCFASPFASA
jgi:hypothetical protein